MKRGGLDAIHNDYYSRDFPVLKSSSLGWWDFRRSWVHLGQASPESSPIFKSMTSSKEHLPRASDIRGAVLSFAERILIK